MGVAGVAFTVMVRLFDVAVVGLAQGEFDVMITEITSPLLSAEVANVGLFVPVLFPFLRHWYDGVVPPLLGVPVKVMVCPEQIVVPGLAEIETEGITELFTVMVIVFDVAGLPVTPDKLEVMVQVIVLPLVNALSV